MKKKVLIIIGFLLLMIGFSYASKTSDYLEYANIKDTDDIDFNGTVDGNIYEVYIDTGSFSYITGSDDKLHLCLPFVGTGYTSKIGEIYFQYEGHGAYACDDNKLRGVFKIGAGGWGHMEDLDNDPEKWKNFLDTEKTSGYFYHNGNGDNTGTGEARLDDIGFANFTTTKTEFNLKSYINYLLSKIKITSINLESGKKANGKDEANIKVCLTYSGSKLKNYQLDDIYFITGYNSDVKKNGDLIPGLKFTNKNLLTDDNGCLTGKVISYVGGEKVFGLKVIKNGVGVEGTGQSDFKYPFSISGALSGDEISDKIVFGYNDKIKFTKIVDSNISDLQFSGLNSNIDLGSNKDYFNILTGNYVKIDGNKYDIKIFPYINTFYSGDDLSFKYIFTGDYKYKIGTGTYDIKNFSAKSNTLKMYKYGLVDYIDFQKQTDSVSADGKSVLWYDLIFYNSIGEKINNITYTGDIKDNNKIFNLNIDGTYNTGFFLTGYADNSNGVYKFGIYSYKPVSDVSLTGLLKNIEYNGYYNITSSNKNINIDGITFNSIVNLSFETKNLKTPNENQIEVDFNKNGGDLNNQGYFTTGVFVNGSGCTFSEGKNISGDAFSTYNKKIKFSCDENPDALIYRGYYKYQLSGDNGQKYVYNKFLKKYSPISFIGGADLKVVGTIVSNKKINYNLNYVSTALSIYKMKNFVRKNIYYNNIIGGKKDTLTTDIDLSTISSNKKIYKCNNDIINIYGTYNHDIKLYFINCSLNIVGDILRNGKGNLSIYLLNKDGKKLNISNYNGWKVAGNLYIKNGVKTIQSNLYMDGSIISYIGGDPNYDSIFTGRKDNDSFRKQLFIQGKIFSKNTLGGGNKINAKYQFIGGKKYDASTNLFGTGIKFVSKAYDLTYLRNDFVHSDGKYDTGDLSEYIYNKYHCTGNKTTDNSKLCYRTIIIEDSNKGW